LRYVLPAETFRASVPVCQCASVPVCQCVSGQVKPPLQRCHQCAMPRTLTPCRPCRCSPRADFTDARQSHWPQPVLEADTRALLHKSCGASSPQPSVKAGLQQHTDASSRQIALHSPVGQRAMLMTPEHVRMPSTVRQLHVARASGVDCGGMPSSRPAKTPSRERPSLRVPSREMGLARDERPRPHDLA